MISLVTNDSKKEEFIPAKITIPEEITIPKKRKISQEVKVLITCALGTPFIWLYKNNEQNEENIRKRSNQELSDYFDKFYNTNKFNETNIGINKIFDEQKKDFMGRINGKNDPLEMKENPQHMKLLKDTQDLVEDIISKLIKEEELTISDKYSLENIHSHYSLNKAIDIAEKNINILKSFKLKKNNKTSVNLINKTISLWQYAINNNESGLKQSGNIESEYEKYEENKEKSIIQSIVEIMKKIRKNVASGTIKVSKDFNIPNIKNNSSLEIVTTKIKDFLGDLENIRSINSLITKKLIDDYIDSLSVIIDKNYIQPMRSYGEINDSPVEEEPQEESNIVNNENILEKLKTIEDYTEIIPKYNNYINEWYIVLEQMNNDDNSNRDKALKIIKEAIEMLNLSNSKDTFLKIYKNLQFLNSLLNKAVNISYMLKVKKSFADFEKTINDKYVPENNT